MNEYTSKYVPFYIQVNGFEIFNQIMQIFMVELPISTKTVTSPLKQGFSVSRKPGKMAIT